MNTTAQVVIQGRARLDPQFAGWGQRRGSPVLTLIGFGLLAAYGTLRWATMLAAAPGGRLVGLIVLAMAIAILGGPAQTARRWVRVPANLAIVLAALAMVPMAGIPLAWVIHLRLAVITRAITGGISTLPGVLVPYVGADRWTRGVIVLGAGMLMLGGALTLATSRRPLGEARLAGAAVPLIVLAVVPDALAMPALSALHGVLMFVLLAMFVRSERIPRGRGPAAAVLLFAVSVAALALTPLIDGARWVSFTTLANKLESVHGESFDWAQSYGRLDWPDQGVSVLTVQARLPSYWKAEDLDLFDGRGWVDAPVGLGDPLVTLSRANLARWEQTITVSLTAMRATQVIVAGSAGRPQLNAVVENGGSPGTFVTTTPLGPGTSYRVDVYTPRPSVAQLQTAGTDYPLADLEPDLTMELPGAGSATVAFAAFGHGTGFVPGEGADAAKERALMGASPYAGVYAIAQRLRAGASTPYAYAEAILHMLGHGFTYDQDVASTPYPIAHFLLDSHTGYCQQFAGAMALLLRMGGVPARVADGFTTGVHHRAAHTYVVSDLDAHAWVEAWFPRIGWVELDPTPPGDADLAGGGASSPAAADTARTLGSADRKGGLITHTKLVLPGAARRSARSTLGSGGSALPIGLGTGALVLVLLGLGLAARRRRPDAGDRLAELERAFARCGRPLGPEVTLAALEARFADTPDAAAYVRTLRWTRFAGGGAVPTAAQRRAVRARLAELGGPLGRIRALAALPPIVLRRRGA